MSFFYKFIEAEIGPPAYPLADRVKYLFHACHNLILALEVVHNHYPPAFFANPLYLRHHPVRVRNNADHMGDKNLVKCVVWKMKIHRIHLKQFYMIKIKLLNLLSCLFEHSA